MAKQEKKYINFYSLHFPLTLIHREHGSCCVVCAQFNDQKKLSAYLSPSRLDTNEKWCECCPQKIFQFNDKTWLFTWDSMARQFSYDKNHKINIEEEGAKFLTMYILSARFSVARIEWNCEHKIKPVSLLVNCDLLNWSILRWLCSNIQRLQGISSKLSVM